MDKPKWNRGDTLLSLKDVLIIGAQALKQCITDGLERLDTRAANVLNREEDEL